MKEVKVFCNPSVCFSFWQQRVQRGYTGATWWCGRSLRRG